MSENDDVPNNAFDEGEPLSDDDEVFDGVDVLLSKEELRAIVEASLKSIAEDETLTVEERQLLLRLATKKRV